MRFIGQILPVDGYVVQVEEGFPVNYGISLTHLYQPLIGTVPIMLFQTLLYDQEVETVSPKTHHSLMNYMNLPLDEIYKARRKLEAIGLLTTFKLNQNDATIYTYKLNSPFSPQAFFQDAMLSQLLLHQIGDQRYDTLKSHFEKVGLDVRGENVTTSFHDVFDTFTPELEVVETVKQEPIIEEVETDFSWLRQMLKQRMIPVPKVLTPENRKAISQIKRLYDLDMYEIEKALLWALTEENELDTEEFKTACHDLFRAKHKNATVKLTEKAQPLSNTKEEEPTTKEEVFIQQMETMSPKQLLEDLSSGNQASPQDLKVIRDVMLSQGLPSPVMNVLIHYVLLQTNMKLSKAYLETIASHWSRAKLKTAKEAMDFAINEREKLIKKQEAKQRPKYYKKQQTKEVIPDWFKNRKSKSVKEKVQTQPVIDLEKEKRELQAMMQAKQKNNHFQG